MDTRHDDVLLSQAIVELTEANLTPAETTPAWSEEVAYLRDDAPASPSEPPPPLVQDIADVLAMEG